MGPPIFAQPSIPSTCFCRQLKHPFHPVFFNVPESKCQLIGAGPICELAHEGLNKENIVRVPYGPHPLNGHKIFSMVNIDDFILNVVYEITHCIHRG